jgi:hypothetical protein
MAVVRNSEVMQKLHQSAMEYKGLSLATIVGFSGIICCETMNIIIQKQWYSRITSFA